MAEYGYCRISRKSQNIERQVRNIAAAYPDAIIKKEAYTGTKIQGRKELSLIVAKVKEGDRIIFDSASRMSRNAEEAMELYEELFNRGVELVFLKEPHINSETYKKTLENQVNMDISTGDSSTDEFITSIIDALNKYTIDLAKTQIRIVFDQAEKEVKDIHIRTSEGIKTAKLNGKQIGQPKGAKLTTRKSVAAKEIMKKHCRVFGGSLSDKEVMHLAGIANNTFYKYKREIIKEFTTEG